MKKNLLKIVLVNCMIAGCLVISGCSKTSTEDKLPQNGAVIDVAGEETQDKEQIDKGEAEQEQEPYVLTFEATTTDGEALTSDIFADSKLTMINVWATYCNPCLAEMPDLGEIATQYDKADFQMIGVVSDVMSDASQEDVDYAKQLITDTGATTYPHLLLNESLYVNLVGAVDAVPTTFFVNQKGELLGYLMGAQAKVTWTSLLEDLLAELE